MTISFLSPLANLETVKRLASRKATVFAMELIPRISRAQPMDALSSQANVAGYKAVILAADTVPKLFPHHDDGGGHHPSRKGLRPRGRA